MHLTGSLQIQVTARDALGEHLPLDRFEAEMKRVQGLSNEALEALCTIIDAADAFEVARKVHRFVAALVCPAPMLARIFASNPAGFNRFCLQVWAFRSFLEHLDRGASARQAGMMVERARRSWLDRELRAHSHVAEDEEEQPVDVYDDEGELDPAAVRAEVDRLLRYLNVEPERVDITILPDEPMPPERHTR